MRPGVVFSSCSCLLAAVLLSCASVESASAQTYNLYSNYLPSDSLASKSQVRLKQPKLPAANFEKHKKAEFASPVDGYFIQVRLALKAAPLAEAAALYLSGPSRLQERASRGLPAPGQHKNFGALKPWEQVHSHLNNGMPWSTNPAEQQSATYHLLFNQRHVLLKLQV